MEHRAYFAFVNSSDEQALAAIDVTSGAKLRWGVATDCEIEIVMSRNAAEEASKTDTIIAQTDGIALCSNSLTARC